MAEKQFPNGIRVFKPNTGAPSFIKGNIAIKKSELIDWLQDQPEDIRLDIKEAKSGNYYLDVNTFKKAEPQNQTPIQRGQKPDINQVADDLPF